MKREIIKIKDYAGTFAENKDTAKRLRIDKIMPALSNKEEVELDFEGVSGATQSFIHALISETTMALLHTHKFFLFSLPHS